MTHNSVSFAQDQGKFFSVGTKVAVLPYYRDAFPSLVHASCLFIKDAVSEQDFYLLLGLCTRSLCDRGEAFAASSCLQALDSLVRQTSRVGDFI